MSKILFKWPNIFFLKTKGSYKMSFFDAGFHCNSFWRKKQTLNSVKKYPFATWLLDL